MKPILQLITRWALTALIFAVACAVALSLWNRHQSLPWTRDGHVRADVIRVASDIGGLVTDVRVEDNQAVKKGQLLFVLDRPRQAAEVEKAAAAIESAQATLGLARSEAGRDLALGRLVATETHERNVAGVKNALADLNRARAEHRIARLNLARTEVRAAMDGRIVNLDLHPGDFLAPGSQAMALVVSQSLRVEGYFEETKLACIHPGDRATIRLLGAPDELAGHVHSIAAGIADDQRTDSHNLLPAVQPTFSWVRLAQRIPVRIHVDDDTRAALLIAGRTATITLQPSQGGPCQ